MAQLRDLPAIDTLLSAPTLAPLVKRYGAVSVRDQLRVVQQEIRHSGAMPDWATEAPGYAARVIAALRTRGYQPIFNLTGTVIHTNLGRALLSDEIWESVRSLVTRPVNLEFDLDRGSRGDRDLIVEERIKALTGAEAATIVNNNAAALLLVLNTFGLDKPVPVSRGELIEIGGSFRLPELMARSGCTLLEVGTTNRTHPRDYEAVVDRASMLLKVHPSNYHIDGFTKEVDAQTLAKIAGDAGIPSCVDLGSGTLIDLSRLGLPKEPTPQSVLKQGVDLVTFSGDKLLGGVQAGIIVGRKDLLAEIKKNPMKRALRADKITLTILADLLRRYEQPETLVQEIPVLNTLTLSQKTLNDRAQRMAAALPEAFHPEITEGAGQIGSGALPDRTIASVCVTLRHETLSANDILESLRALDTPVIGRIAQDLVWLDARGAAPIDELVSLLGQLR